MINRKALLIVLWFFIIPSNNLAQTYVWTQKASLPSQPRMGAAGFSIGTKGYAVGGYTGSAVLKETWEYDSQTNTWSQKADLTGPVRYNASGFAINNKGYVCLGWSNTNGTAQLSDLWEYDPLTNAWTAKNPFPGGARYTASVFVIGYAAYVGLGYQPLYNDFYRYEPALNLWTQVASLPSGNERQSAGSFCLNGKGYIACGNKANTSYFKDLWQYNPINNQWTQKMSIPGDERLGPAFFQINNLGFMGLGSQNNSPLADSYFYMDSANQWIAAPLFQGVLRENPTCWEFPGMGFLNFGKNPATNTYLNDSWVLMEFVSVSENSFLKDLIIWPQPIASGYLNISSNQVIHQVKIVDHFGRVLFKTSDPRSNYFRVDMTNFSKGTYLLQIASGSTFATHKIIKL